MADVSTKATTISEVTTTGKVKWYDPRKGIGYIAGDDGHDYFVHFSNIKIGHRRTVLLDGEDVTFAVKEGQKGPEAAQVVITPHNQESED